MHKTRTKEKEISKSLKNKNPYTLKIFKAMAFCIYVYDNLFYTNHLENIKAIYFLYSDESAIKLTDKVNSSDRTFIRYRNNYLKCFMACDFAVKYFDEIFSFIK